jgi:hypothetical protein
MMPVLEAGAEPPSNTQCAPQEHRLGEREEAQQQKKKKY